jgi:hypothetical protein
MLLIYLPKYSLRCQYVFELIFKEEFGIQFQLTTDINEFQEHNAEKINYSNEKISSGFFIKAYPFLFEDQIKQQEIKVEEKDALKILFSTEDDDLGFDIFAGVFYMVSRYEEYLPFNADKFGRFKAVDSLAFKNDFLQKPIVNIWIEVFKKALKNKFNKLELKSTVFNAIVTYDIDVAYKYKGRSLGRTLGSAFKDVIGFSVQNFKERIQTLLQSKKDPWDVYDDLKKLIGQNHLSSVFFFLLADKSEHDRNLDYRNPLMKKLVNQVKTFSEIGIHPSFYTSSFAEKILIEKARLEKLSSKKITKSRQHYLKFNLPDTYNFILSAGITEDYSMGFPEEPGFRAGTCKPFYFYDLKKEKATGLKIFPVTFMESSLMSNLSLNPVEAFEKIGFLLKGVKNVDGTFISLWHNHTISETKNYKEWKSIHEKMINEISLSMQDDA